MSNKEKKSPELRFKGFSDAWEQRKLIEFVDDVGTGKSTFTSGREKSPQYIYPVLGSTNIISYDQTYDYSGNFILTARVGANAGRLYTYQGRVKISDNTVYIQTENRSFIYNLLLKFNLKKLSYGTGQPLIKSSELKKLKIWTPDSNQEQINIGEFLMHMESVITLHQRKINILKKLKQEYLSLMFANNGHSTPMLRFKQFERDWEKHKLKDVSERVTRKNKDNTSTLPLTISAQDGLVDQNTYYKKQIASRDMSNYYLLKKGDFAYNKSYSNGFPLGVVKRLDKYEYGVLSILYIVFRPTQINSDFLLFYYETNKWHKEVLRLSAEGARNHGLLNISVKDFFDTKMRTPISEKEQVEIGVFLMKLEKIINLQHNKMSVLEKIKKTYLHKMFL